MLRLVVRTVQDAIFSQELSAGVLKECLILRFAFLFYPDLFCILGKMPKHYVLKNKRRCL